MRAALAAQAVSVDIRDQLADLPASDSFHNRRLFPPATSPPAAYSTSNMRNRPSPAEPIWPEPAAHPQAPESQDALRSPRPCRGPPDACTNLYGPVSTSVASGLGKGTGVPALVPA